MKVFALFFLAVLFVSCGPERYPLAIYSGQTFLETQDRSGRTVVLLVDTGAPQSLVARPWVEGEGGTVEPSGPNAASGFQLYQQWHHRARHVPVPRGVPPVLEGLPVVDYERSGFLGWAPGLPGPLVGILGADVLWDAAMDFRGTSPELVLGGEVLPRTEGRIRYDLYQDGGHYVVHSSFYRLNAQDLLEGRNEVSVIDTGCAYPYVAFFPQPPPWPTLLRNGLTPLRVNGQPVVFFSTEGFQIETSQPDPFVAVAFDGPASPPMNLLGTPFFHRYRAYIDLKRWTFEFSPGARPEPNIGTGLDAAALWAWQAVSVAGKGIRVGTVEANSTLGLRGVREGDLVTEVGGEPVDRPRSVLEWRRLWVRFATGSPTP